MISEPQFPETLFAERLFMPFVILRRAGSDCDWRIEKGADNYLRGVADANRIFEQHGGQCQVWKVGEHVRTLLYERGSGEIVSAAFGVTPS